MPVDNYVEYIGVWVNWGKCETVRKISNMIIFGISVFSGEKEVGYAVNTRFKFDRFKTTKYFLIFFTI